MRATARAQPNIALIKYWGKRDRDRNLPAVGSISLTLDELYTTMDVELDGGLDRDELDVNGRSAPSMLPRVTRCLDTVLGADRLRARVVSESNFPIAAGLASSASSFAALVVAASAAGGRAYSVDELADLAGRASGSAARSLYGGFVELRNDGDGIDVNTLLEGEAWPLRIVAAVTSQAPKPVSSGEAMEVSRRTSPFYSRWIEEQDMDLSTAGRHYRPGLRQARQRCRTQLPENAFGHVGVAPSGRLLERGDARMPRECASPPGGGCCCVLHDRRRPPGQGDLPARR